MNARNTSLGAFETCTRNQCLALKLEPADPKRKSSFSILASPRFEGIRFVRFWKMLSIAMPHWKEAREPIRLSRK
ncbi:unnamed protein product [Periconia digitata]|uniref:Uncharacterized protein n=1 Tax=Periconia digitata TaxID=1303443 RepID=A0A9W4XEH6_9PLEO|nr:unnamed protein product [Periconia digitata]